MKFFSTVLFLSLAGISAANAAGGSRAGFTINPSLWYSSRQTDNGSGTTTDVSTTNLGMHFGYAMSSGLYFGAGYDGGTGKVGSSSLAFSAMSADVGYYVGAWSFVASYILSVSSDQTATLKYSGTGYGASIGYMFNGGSSWGFGPLLSYVTATFDKQTNGGTESALTPNATLTDLSPKFAFWFHF